MPSKTPNSVWLDHAKITNNPEGDLIADMQSRYRQNPESFPQLFPNISAMRSYLAQQNACHEALEAVQAVWRRYKRWLDRNGTRWAARG